MHLPFVNLGAKSQPNSFDGHRFETICLQHTSARLILFLLRILFRTVQYDFGPKEGSLNF